MCRLLGVVASRPAPLSRLPAGDLEPFRALADEHRDGWGIAYRPAASGSGAGGAGEPVVRKAPEHALAGAAAAIDEVAEVESLNAQLLANGARPLPNGCVLEVRPDATTRVHDAGTWRRAG